MTAARSERKSPGAQIKNPLQRTPGLPSIAMTFLAQSSVAASGCGTAAAPPPASPAASAPAAPAPSAAAPAAAPPMGAAAWGRRWGRPMRGSAPRGIAWANGHPVAMAHLPRIQLRQMACACLAATGNPQPKGSRQQRRQLQQDISTAGVLRHARPPRMPHHGSCVPHMLERALAAPVAGSPLEEPAAAGQGAVCAPGLKGRSSIVEETLA